MNDSGTHDPKLKGGKKFNKDKTVTLILVISILSVSAIIGWLVYKPKLSDFSPANITLSGPDLEFKFAIGGDGSKGEYRMAEPMGVDIAENGDIYVADTLNSMVKVFDRDGKFKNSFGGKNLFYLPSDLAVNNDSVFVVDGKNSRIQVFDLNGKFKKTFAGPETGKKIGAWIPAAITLDGKGAIYATDIFYHRVIVFDKNGQIKNHFGAPGNGKGQLSYPNGIAVDKTGNVYVADSNNGRIQVFDAGGKFINTLNNNKESSFLNMPRGIAFGQKNYLYIAETFSHRLAIPEVDNDRIDNTITVGNRGVGNGEMNFPNDVALKQNILAVADRANNRILVYSVDE